MTPKVLIVYYSRSGNTKKMAEAIADGAREAKAEVEVRTVEEASISSDGLGQSLPSRRGPVCRRCGCRQFRVACTRPTWGGRIMRRRECRHCGKRMTTWEKGGPGRANPAPRRVGYSLWCVPEPSVRLFP